jgi:hypothetical protein
MPSRYRHCPIYDRADERSKAMKLQKVAVSISLCACLAACTSRQNAAPLTDAQNEAKTRLETQMKDAAQTTATYHAMDNPTLLTHLVEQSKALREPFNSLSYRELRTRTNVEPNTLTALVKGNQDVGGLLPLLLLRLLDSKSYLAVSPEMRAKILTDSLVASKTFNTWGLPNAYLEDASKAMIETGRSAVPALRRMLADTRPAPIFGSKEAMVAQQYNYRLCDYALFFLKQIAGDTQFMLPKTAEERDALIKAEK